MKKVWWLLPAALFIAGCGNSRVVETETGDKVSLEREEGGYKIQGENYTQSVGNKAELPPGFPSDMPVYTGARLVFGQAAAGIFTVGWVTDNELGNIKAFYLQSLPAQGWKTESPIELGDKVIINASKGGRSVMLGLEPSTDAQVGGQTRISLNLTSY